MVWHKKGLIFKPSGDLIWSHSHAQVPTPFYTKSGALRVFYATRCKNNISRVSYVDLDPQDPTRIIYIHNEPVIQEGLPGAFDDCGVMPSWTVENNGRIYLYYIGWNVRNTVPYYNSVGLAISEDDGQSFVKFSSGPLWDRNYKEPFFSASTCVLFNDGIWKCWYLSCTEYRLIEGKYEPRYHIKYAESHDGVEWERNGIIAIDYKSEEEAGIVKASVLVENKVYKMWYSYRNFTNYRTDKDNSYKIGYAESTDGIHWVRKDDSVGIHPSATGWDNNMMAYPHVIKLDNKYTMFYNGNGFGQQGFGFAEASEI